MIALLSWTPLWVAFPTMALASAAIAYAIVFRTPLFGGGEVWGDYYGGAYSYDYSYPEDVRDLASRQPEEVQQVVAELFKELTEKSDSDLFILKSLPDVCIAEFYCRGLKSVDVKPFIEAALAHKQTREASLMAADSAATARWSLAVAFAAFLFGAGGHVIAFLSYRRRLNDITRNAPIASSPPSSP